MSREEHKTAIELVRVQQAILADNYAALHAELDSQLTDGGDEFANAKTETAERSYNSLLLDNYVNLLPHARASSIPVHSPSDARTIQINTIFASQQPYFVLGSAISDPQEQQLFLAKARSDVKSIWFPYTAPEFNTYEKFLGLTVATHLLSDLGSKGSQLGTTPLSREEIQALYKDYNGGELVVRQESPNTTRAVRDTSDKKRTLREKLFAKNVVIDVSEGLPAKQFSNVLTQKGPTNYEMARFDMYSRMGAMAIQFGVSEAYITLLRDGPQELAAVESTADESASTFLIL